MKKRMENKGFTLIEILISIAIMSILALGLLSLQYILSQNQIAAFKSYKILDEVNSGISIMVREIRNAREADNGAYTIESADANELVFYSDYDFDGEVEKIRYQRTGSVIEKAVIEPVGFPTTYPADQERVRQVTDNFTDDSQNLFTYYNRDWPEDQVDNPLPTPAEPSEISLVKIYIVINQSGQPDQNYILESFAQIRSVKITL